MAGRGRGRKPEEARKSKPISIRFPAHIFSELERAAAEGGRSLAEEINARLVLSLHQNEAREKAFGGTETQVILLLIARVLTGLSQLGNHWLKDPYLFNQAEEAIAEILDVKRPTGEPFPAENIIELWQAPPFIKTEEPKAETLQKISEYPLGRMLANAALTELSFARRAGNIDQDEDIKPSSMPAHVLLGLALSGVFKETEPNRPLWSPWASKRMLSGGKK
jgi:hypothetical protein